MKTIIDVSSVVYGGHNGKDWRIKGFPVGGIRKLFGLINSSLNSSDFILCFDGGETIKKELYPTYKAGRIPDFSVFAQIDLLKQLLTDCDIPFYYDPHYEADDFVFSACKELSMLGDTEDVVIYSDDRDLACCVTDLVSLKNSTSLGVCIDRNNYEDRVVNNRSIPYNSILLWKVFHGDPSDNYKALRIPGLTFETFSRRYLMVVENLIENEGLTDLAYAEYPIFEMVANDFANVLTEENMISLLKQGRLAFPYSVPVSDVDTNGYIKELRSGNLLYVAERKHMKMFGLQTFNMKKFQMYCTLLGLNRTKPGRMVDRDSAEAQEFYDLLEVQAKELSSGALAVERYKNKRIVAPREETLANMALPL